MSSLDRWIAPYVHPDMVATFATAATVGRTSKKTNVLAVASKKRQAATIHAPQEIVATRRIMLATDKRQQNQTENGDVANVAEVATTWDASDWCAFYNERAGIAEYDGGLNKPDAEELAYEAAIAKWLMENPPSPASPKSCAYCNEAVSDDDTLAVSAITGNHAFQLHGECFNVWQTIRRRIAVAALAAMGIVPPPLTNASTNVRKMTGIIQKRDIF